MRKKISYNGRSQSLAAWCRELKLPRGTIAQRISRGATPQEALDLGPCLVKKILTGKKFGFLTVIRPARTRSSGGQTKTAWVCQCQCGQRLAVWTQALTQGNTTSCGCHGKGRERSQGRTKEHTSWRAMMQRCYNPNNVKYHEYGAKGIGVYRIWHNFNQFMIDVGKAPSLRHTLDRYPSRSGNYTPGNVRWATPRQQANNRNRP